MLIYRHIRDQRARRRTGSKLMFGLLKFLYMTLVALVVGASLMSDTDDFLKGLHVVSGVCVYWFSLMGWWGKTLAKVAWNDVDITEIWHIMLLRSILQFTVSLVIMMPASLMLLEHESHQPIVGVTAAEITVAILICAASRLFVAALLSHVDVSVRCNDVADDRKRLLLREIFRM